MPSDFPRRWASSGRARLAMILGIYGLIAAIIFLDWITPPGVVVGLLLGVPIVLSSVYPRRGFIVVATVTSALGFVVAAVLTRGPIVPQVIRLPNRMMALAGILASGAVALLLQRLRLAAEMSRDRALSTRDMNRLLLALLAHDLRSPLVLASQSLAYVERADAEGRPIDRKLLADTQARLQRNLRTIDLLLSTARSEVERNDHSGDDQRRTRTRVGAQIAAELASFGDESLARGKPIELHMNGLDSREYVLDAMVLRQALSIVIDNALRHALPGAVSVEAHADDDRLRVRVEDKGPGLSAHRAGGSGSSAGSGLGLQLCRALLARAGGSLVLERDGSAGTAFVLSLPAAEYEAAIHGNPG